MLQFSVPVRNAILDAIEAAILAAGGIAQVRLYSGPQPANTAAAESGTRLLSVNLPAGDFMSAAANAQKLKAGVWSGIGEGAAGAGMNAGHFRVYDSLNVCHAQGRITASNDPDPGEMTMDSIAIISGEKTVIDTFTLNGPNA